MRVHCSSLVLIVTLEVLVLAAMLPMVRAMRYAQQRASCINGLKQQVPATAAHERD